MTVLRDFLAFVGLALTCCALARCIAPPPASVLVTVPDPAGPPIHDLDLKGARND